LSFQEVRAVSLASTGAKVDAGHAPAGQSLARFPVLTRLLDE
jgi:hypothetical protein